MSYNILHLSDLHVGDMSVKAADLGNQVGGMLKDHYKKPIDKVIVTGDIFDIKAKGTDNEVSAAVDFFRRLLLKINMGAEQKKRKELTEKDILIVPGNHDLRSENTDNPWHLYDKFLKDLYGTSWPDGLDRETRTVICKEEKEKILFLGFNSYDYDATEDQKNKKDTDSTEEGKTKKVENGSKTAEIEKNGREAVIDSNQLDIVEDSLNEYLDYVNYYKVVFFHHPFYLFPENMRNANTGIIQNAVSLSKQLARWNVKLVLHGHKHDERQTVIWSEKEQRIDVLAAGSIGKNGIKPSCNLVELEPDTSGNLGKRKIELKILKKKDAEFNIIDKELQNGNQEGLLKGIFKNKLVGYPEDTGNEFNAIIELLDGLCLSRDALCLIEYHEGYRNLLTYSIRYRIQFWMVAYDDAEKESLEQVREEFKSVLDGVLDEARSGKVVKTWPEEYFIKDVINLLEEKKFILHRDTMHDLESDMTLRQSFSYITLAVLVTDISMTFRENYWRKIQNSRNPAYAGNGIGSLKDHICMKYDNTFGYVFVQMQCNDADTQRAAIQSVYDIRDRFYGLFKYFRSIGLKIKNIMPDVVNSDMNEIRCYEMDASIPRMIQLLTGTNIYASDLVFARELIQNAIDAISFREKNGDKKFNKTIVIDIGRDETDGEYFRITDHGIGMGQDIIGHYFTTLGRSYYKEYDLETGERLNYNSISNFGIGFLSVFRPCRKIIVQTKHYDSEEYYRMEINENQDYFLVDTREDDSFLPGTIITCYFKPEKTGIIQQLPKYIQRIMRDIKYDIRITDALSSKKEKTQIKARAVRFECQNSKRIFLPFDEEKNQVITDYDNYFDKPSYLKKYRHGALLQFDTEQADSNGTSDHIEMLNAGVLMENAKPENIVSSFAPSTLLKHCNITMNFPPNWLDIDVSREKVSGFRSMRKREYDSVYGIDDFRKEVYVSFKNQLIPYFHRFNDTSLAALAEAESFISRFGLNGGDEKKAIDPESVSGLTLTVKFNETHISFSVVGSDILNGDMCRDGGWPLRIRYGENSEEEKGIHQILNASFDEIQDSDLAISLLQMPPDRMDEGVIANILEKVGIKCEENDKQYLPVALSVCFSEDFTIWKENNGQSESNDTALIHRMKSLIYDTVLSKYTLKDLEKQKTFSVFWKDRPEVRREMRSDDLGTIVKSIAADEEFGEEENVNKYEFLWKHIFRVEYLRYYGIPDEEQWSEIVQQGQSGYLEAKTKIKNLYAANTDRPLLDVYMIAACYMESFLELANQDAGSLFSDAEKNCQWILECGTHLVYIWKLSEYKILGAESEKYLKWKEQKTLLWPQENRVQSESVTSTSLQEENPMRKRYLKMLARRDAYQEKFDILGFAELLNWLALYNEEHLG